jgi:CubicO group peptidase (beta-lactamase class C family)
MMQYREYVLLMSRRDRDALYWRPGQVVFLAATAALAALAQSSTKPIRNDGPLSLARKTDAIFAPYEQPSSPGCALGVIQNGSFLYKRGYGLGSVELQTALTPKSVFYMGSISKQFTAASAVLAAEEGYLSLDDDLRKWIPEIPFYGHTITLRQMLHHTSGFRDEIGLMSLAGQHIEDIHSKAEVLDLIARQKRLNFMPGEAYQYSNSNYVLLAEVIRRATGRPLSVFAEENIFQPLGMTHTHFYDDRSVVLPGRVAAYAPRESGGFRVDWSTNFEKVGDGGLMSSVDDLLLWDRNFYDNKLGKGTLVRELQTRGVLNSGKQIDYALGLFITRHRGLPVVEHGGALFGYRTAILRFPDQHFSVVCLCNLASANPEAEATEVADLYLEGKFPQSPEPGSKPATQNDDRSDAHGPIVADLRNWAGLYRDPKERTFVMVIPRDGGLEIRNPLVDSGSPNEAAQILKQEGNGRFVDPRGPQYIFESAANGRADLTMRSGNGSEHTLTRIHVVDPTTAELMSYAGNYVSEELATTYRLSSKNGSLLITVGWNPPIEMQPGIADEFRGRLNGEFREPIVIGFVRDHSLIDGFDLFAGSADGVREIRFVKSHP